MIRKMHIITTIALILTVLYFGVLSYVEDRNKPSISSILVLEKDIIDNKFQVKAKFLYDLKNPFIFELNNETSWYLLEESQFYTITYRHDELFSDAEILHIYSETEENLILIE
ncbi:hypothetical protein [Chengkuizengella axinellae]|uniref:DUF3139 domain-containing protein n=1 Tax=Chengkuizengella axinellae TaxID=3064388 RepID=A0ABT9IZ31_9BACL|nr:hypothetical protein [Chengkuizengella sp. 2205SS18-9]MDP5274626.1 hypothetical protein [Chengkuizengella sp. 2205SS18-9]